jgi:hypothetical protein
MTFEFDAVLREWDARREDTWVFADLPEPLADEIAEIVEGRTRGFGSVRVDVTLGGSHWRTSIFPGASTYALPVKKAVRRAEGVGTGDDVHVTIALVDVP